MATQTGTRAVCFVADDFGASEAINEAIVHAHRHGVLQLACLMMGQPGTAHAIELARANPDLQIGWHLHLCDSIPTTVDAWPWGESPARAGIRIAFSRAARSLAAAEIEDQWQMIADTGLPVAAVNAHHHLHWHPWVRRQLERLLAGTPGFGGWLRWGDVRFFGRDRAPSGYAMINRLLLGPARSRLAIPGSQTLWGVDRTFAMRPSEVLAALSDLPDGLHEFMFHPRPGDDDPDTQCLVELRQRDYRRYFDSGSETVQP
jgi:predicted glycoside hydrolase/deacetylase ChbG (UPF0249 family)